MRYTTSAPLNIPRKKSPAGSPPRVVLPVWNGRAVVDITIGEVLYLVLVVAVAWWAYSVLKEYF